MANHSSAASNDSEWLLFLRRLNDLQKRFEASKAAVDENLNDFFLIVMGGFVFLMLPGFAFLEAGSVRSRNATNSLYRNMIGSFIACIAYWIFGYAFAFGEPTNGFIGYGNFALNHTPINYSHFFFQFVFAAATNCIVSGAVAERMEVFGYFAYSSLIPGFIYAVVTHWTWSSTGWLANLNVNGYEGKFQDFAGSGGVHVCGGACALAGAIALGPRLGRFSQTPKAASADGSKSLIMKTRTEFSGHSVPLATIGGFLLMLGFVGFNGGSQLTITKPGDGYVVSNVVANTIVSGAFGALATIILVRIVKRRWSLLQSINGALAGMVAICSGCDVMFTWAAAVTGFVAGMAYLAWAFVISKLRIDDPLETVALHCGSGAWGLIATAIFDFNHGIVYFGNTVSFYALAFQFIGLAAILAWSFILAGTMFLILRLYAGRVPSNVEVVGLDVTRHKESAYNAYQDYRYSSSYYDYDPYAVTRMYDQSLERQKQFYATAKQPPPIYYSTDEFK